MSSMKFPLTIAADFSVVPDAQGPSVTPTADGFSIQRNAATADNQWTHISNATLVPVGSYFSFDINVSTIQPATEVKLTLPANLILRYNNNAFSYTYYSSTGSFVSVAPSSIVPDQTFRHVQLNFTSSGVQIVEDGAVKGQFSTSVGSNNHVQCDFQILARGSSLNAQIKNMRVGVTQ